MARKNMHPEDIKAAVRKTGVTLSSLGSRSDVSSSGIRAAVWRPVPSANRVIAAYLGKSLNDIWPEWFAPDGTRLYLKKNNICDNARRSSKEGAA